MSKCGSCVFRTEEKTKYNDIYIRCSNPDVQKLTYNNNIPQPLSTMPLEVARQICSSKDFIYHQPVSSEYFVNFGDAVARPSGRQAQYACRYFGLDDGFWQKQGYELAIEFLRFANFDFPSDNRLTNHYHSLMIHRDDVQPALDALSKMGRM